MKPMFPRRKWMAPAAQHSDKRQWAEAKRSRYFKDAIWGDTGGKVILERYRNKWIARRDGTLLAYAIIGSMEKYWLEQLVEYLNNPPVRIKRNQGLEFFTLIDFSLTRMQS
jgi:hypothetical protein